MEQNYWYIVTVQLSFEDENGKVKNSNEDYLVQAVSPSDAETKVANDFEGENIVYRLKKVQESKIVKIIE